MLCDPIQDCGLSAKNIRYKKKKKGLTNRCLCCFDPGWLYIVPFRSVTALLSHYFDWLGTKNLCTITDGPGQGIREMDVC